MEPQEVPLERTQEELHHRAEEAEENWILGVALTAAVLAVLAAINSLLAEHYANHAMIEQIKSSDQWAYYQAKGIKGNELSTRIEILRALGKTPTEQQLQKLAAYQANQEQIQREARRLSEESDQHFRRHTILTPGVTFYQIAIAVGRLRP